jgi:NAD(P)H-hydrate repair Nnr-like enzyme with NAD(P)H-hydrate dehydratase domain
MDFDYWLKQEPKAPLFPDIEWQKPQQKALSGKLLLLGGNAHSFAAVAQAYSDAITAGVGECRVVLPDALKKSIDPLALDCLFVPTNQSGGLTKDSLPQLKAVAVWADGLLFIGDAGRNSETAIVYEQLLRDFANKPTLITRDAADLLKTIWPTLLQRPNTVLLLTLAQLQKLFQAVYYPKTILFSMQLTNLVEALHKFTITYPCTLVVFHQNQLVVASGGQVSSTPWQEPLLIWRGSVAAKAAVYTLQHKNIFQAVTTSVVLAVEFTMGAN